MGWNVHRFERLVIGLEGTVWRETGTKTDRLSLVISIRNPIVTRGGAQRPPRIELRDSAGRVYATSNADLVEPLSPGDEITSQVHFDIARDASGLELVLDAGAPNEVHTPVQEMAWSENP
jgi:hypothetical protein